jgi:hypothetical protein
VNDHDSRVLIDSQKNVNTRLATESHMRLFTSWLAQENEFRRPEQIPETELNTYLAHFFIGVRKNCNAEGKDINHPSRQYEPETLTAIQCSIQRYLSDNGSIYNIKADGCFKHSRDVLAAKKKELKQLGKGNKPNASKSFSNSDIEILFEKNLLGTGNSCNCDFRA